MTAGELFDWIATSRAVCEALGDILVEFRRAERKFPTFPRDIIHGAAIVGEERGEVPQAALQFTYEGGSKEAVRREAVQVAAMAIRLLLMLEHMDARPSDQATRQESP